MAIIGREPFVDIVLPFPQVSSRHACLEPLGAGRYRVVDLGSSNGTYVSGRKVGSGDVRDGEDLRFGSVSFDWNAHRGTLNAEATLPQGMTLGRDPACELVVSDGRVSNRHLRVIPQADRLVILDLGSANGLSVNGRPVARASVSATDDVRLGSLRVDLFSLVSRRSAPARVAPVPPPQPAWVPPPTVPASPPTAVAAPVRRGTQGWVWAAVVVLVLVGGGAGFAYATREDIVETCALCPAEIFHEKALFWQANDARARGSHAREQVTWCSTHGSELVTVKKTHKCKVCGKTINSEDVRAPRNTRPQDTEVVDGVCSDRCQNELLLRDAASGAKDLGGKVLDSLNPFK